ncbi:MAG: excisionase family DNA-binding protein [Spirochaetes bacterium]|nr:excisionase family DNA-binding protein [Spirochaetota bacterium]
MNSVRTETTPTDVSTLWTYAEASRYLRRSESQLRHDVQYRKIPFFKVGRMVRFSREQLDSWVKSKEVSPRGH